MDITQAFGMGLGNIALLSSAKTRSISAENPDGAPGNGAKEVPEAGKGPSGRLGKGWKVRPCISLDAGETATIAEMAGPGVIQHIWMTVDPKGFRDIVLRIYWDGEETPSVEAPLGDFFANGHALRAKVNSLPVAVNPAGALNCYWPMPFRRSAKITVENQRWERIEGFFFQVTYALQEVPENAAYLHAQWRRSVTRRDCPEHVLIDGVRGQGHYVGTYLAWTQLANG